LQLDFPFFLYFLQHFFFLPPQATSQFIVAHGEYNDGVVFDIKLIFIKSK